MPYIKEEEMGGDDKLLQRMLYVSVAVLAIAIIVVTLYLIAKLQGWVE